MFLEKHWSTILLISVLLVIASNARAETYTNAYIERTQYMYDRSTHGPGIPDVYRVYDSEADVVCYMLSSTQNSSCVPNTSQKMRDKYKKYRDGIEEKARLEYEAKKIER